MKNALYLLLLFLLEIPFACSQNREANVAADSFSFLPPVSHTVSPTIAEASGIAESKTYPGHLWVEEDSGNPTQIMLLSHSGKVVKTVTLKNVTNRDWEDMAVADGQVYIGDIGDNDRRFNTYTIYQFTEPKQMVDAIDDVKSIRFQYPDGAHDAEAFLVDERSKDIFIITKRDEPSRIYKIAYPYHYDSINRAVSVGQLTYSGVVSAAVSPDRNHILVKTYLGIFHYPRKSSGDDMATMLSGKPDAVPYKMEPQGEAVTFAADGSGFFTLSEKGNAKTVELYFYQKK